ncbi:hypothetical protein BDP81DRAFT_45851 [Colletotrichum phormii]|uniref:Uncharacterized protein n=1 Tax=Colletotrichum phormii TaxID=359342 RepID=A0AAJ0EFJ2_9PEZI|nr:uncharacterized protein BDP81DRAFT_45851 [Colletotrichum phormii]KAK1635141.1 hypothetical protein BDP81DRAFT_45851 [Colletotrichum phormii]
MGKMTVTFSESSFTDLRLKLGTLREFLNVTVLAAPPFGPSVAQNSIRRLRIMLFLADNICLCRRNDLIYTGREWGKGGGRKKKHPSGYEDPMELSNKNFSVLFFFLPHGNQAKCQNRCQRNAFMPVTVGQGVISSPREIRNAVRSRPFFHSPESWRREGQGRIW